MTKSGEYRERRNALRYDASIDGRVKSSMGAVHRVEISDLSEGGCSVRHDQRSIRQGLGYALKIGGLESLGAELRWNTDESAGFEFERPLHPAVVDHIVVNNPPQREENCEASDEDDPC